MELKLNWWHWPHTNYFVHAHKKMRRIQFLHLIFISTLLFTFVVLLRFFLRFVGWLFCFSPFFAQIVIKYAAKYIFFCRRFINYLYVRKYECTPAILQFFRVLERVRLCVCVYDVVNSEYSIQYSSICSGTEE